MTANPQNIWSVPAYLPYLQPQLTDEIVAAAEEQLGVVLPTEYLDLLRVQNGGYIRFQRPDSVGDVIAGIGPHFPSIFDFDWTDAQEYVSYPLDGLLPFDGDGHWYLCFDYRGGKKSPSVTYADVECDSQEHLATTFAEYLSSLCLGTEDFGTYAVLEDSDLDTIASRLSEKLAKRCEDTGDQDHGYSTYRWKLGREWIWASPNLVPRGFVRRDDERYEDLKDMLPGLALRYPEMPQAACLLSATDNAEAAMLDACEQAELAVRPLVELV